MAFTPDEEDLEYAIDNLQDIEFDIKKTIGHVFNNEYILIIGSEVILKPSVVPSGDVNDYILGQVNNRLKGRNYKSFDEVMQHSNNNIDPIRNFVTWDKFQSSMIVDDISEELQGLLRTKLFRIVITTTFDTYLEKLMHEIWPDEDLNVVNVWNDTSLEKFYDCLSMYRNVRDYNAPTLIYAFGRCEKGEENFYARRDFDYIQTIEKWLGFDKRENLMMQFILCKRLLSLGCKFDDWYFRFFWYILRREEVRHCEGDIVIIFDEKDRSDKNLENYLKNTRVVTQTKVNVREFMRQLTNIFTCVDSSNEYRDEVFKYRRRGKIFFSYCHDDKHLARQIFQQLRSYYPNLWFDQDKILGGDNYDDEIKSGIQNAKIFIPLLSPKVAEDLKSQKVDNYYNDEWRMAAVRQSNISIIPLATDGFSQRDGYYKIFEDIIGRKASCISWTDSNALDNIKEAIDKNLK